MGVPSRPCLPVRDREDQLDCWTEHKQLMPWTLPPTAHRLRVWATALLFFFHDRLERIPSGLGKLFRLLHSRLGDFEWVHATEASALRMHLHHDAVGLGRPLVVDRRWTTNSIGV
jgi:hypothetical protein